MKRLLPMLVVGLATFAHADVLHFNGPVVDGSGLSVLTLPATTFGFGAQTGSSNAVADNFSVASGTQWMVSTLDFFSYQTGAGIFPFLTATWSVVSGDVNTGVVVASGTTAVTDGGLMGYRVTSTTLGDTQRKIYRAEADVADFLLASGDYWLRWSLTGSLASGPWQPPTSDAATGNAAQSTTGGPFATLTEAGSGLTVELPFQINGTIDGVVNDAPEPGTLILLGLGLVGLAVTRKRKQA